MDWLWLVIAGVLEVAWAFGMVHTDGFRKPGPTALTLIAMFASVYCLTLAVRTIPLGTGYAVWTGIGAVGTVAVGIAFLNESANGPRLVFTAIILLGILGLKMTGGH